MNYKARIEARDAARKAQKDQTEVVAYHQSLNV